MTNTTHSNKLTKTICLVGLMGSGKTTFGRILAKKLGVRFLDSDIGISKQEERSVKRIFEVDGEEYFRDVEREYIRNILENEEPCIFALGGGAYIDDETRHLVEKHAMTIWLYADLDTLYKRLKHDKKRPLLQTGNRRNVLRDLVRNRYPIYKNADIRIKTSDRVFNSILDEAVVKINLVERGVNSSIVVDLGSNSYPILVDNNLMDNHAAFMREYIRSHDVVIVSDSNVAPLHLDNLKGHLADYNITEVIVKAGEASKSFDNVGKILSGLLDNKPDRQTTVIALGGGVVGDLSGFVASILMRGVPFIQVPTSLLAMVDSSVGGKTGVNTPQGKNLIGAFYQPRIVMADINTLRTLPQREVLAGFAEVIKYGILGDAKFFGWLEHNIPTDVKIDDNLIYAITKSCKAKARIVAADEREQGKRALLNLGHTFGHALETECGYDGTLLHGEAVAIGMCMAMDFSVSLGLCKADEALRVRKYIKAVGLPTDAKEIKQFDPQRILELMQGDKKNYHGKIVLVLCSGIGRSFIYPDAHEDEILNFLKEQLS